MKIDPRQLDPASASQAGKAQETAGVAAGGGRSFAGRANEGADRVDLSDLSGTLLASASADTPDRAARVDRLAAEVRKRALPGRCGGPEPEDRRRGDRGMNPERDRIRQVLQEIEAARVLLLSPSAQALDRGSSHLERAAAELKNLLAERAAKPVWAGGLRQAVSQVSILLESAAAFYVGWSRQAAAAACGYMPSGEPARPAAHRSLSVEG
jgi:hypothetical protein